jgi:hypothetical protein
MCGTLLRTTGVIRSCRRGARTLSILSKISLVRIPQVTFVCSFTLASCFASPLTTKGGAKYLEDAANGIFIWVVLVVQPILERLVNCDRVVDLRRRVSELPTELDDYFASILKDSGKFYHKQAAHMFQKTGVRLRQMWKRLNACCKGLLEAQFYDFSNHGDSSLPSSTIFNEKVDFLHRTAFDFLTKEDMQGLLKQWSGHDFDTNRIICEGLLAQIKTSPQGEEYSKDGGPLSKLIRAFDYHVGALKGDQKTKATGMSLFNELDRTRLVTMSVR